MTEQAEAASGPLATLRAFLRRWDIHPLTALRCTPALAVALGLGLATGDVEAGAIACGAALVVGFGVYQSFARSQFGPMLAATLGMAVSTQVGTVAGLHTASMLPAVAWWGFSCALLPALGLGAQWIGQQSTIFLLVAGSFPETGPGSVIRAALVLAGGSLQIAMVELSCRLADLRREVSGWSETRRELAEGVRTLRAALSPRSLYFRFGLRLAATLCAGEFIARSFDLPNGYWIGMTVVLLLRMDFHDTWTRSIARVLGTAAGLLLAMVLIAWLRPGEAAMAALVLVFAMLCFAFLRTHYGLFSAWVSVYIVALLVFAGLAEATIIDYRLLDTAIGAALAIAGHIRLSNRAERDRAAA
jgi:hypothetical protein